MSLEHLDEICKILRCNVQDIICFIYTKDENKITSESILEKYRNKPRQSLKEMFEDKEFWE